MGKNNRDTHVFPFEPADASEPGTILGADTLNDEILRHRFGSGQDIPEVIWGDHIPAPDAPRHHGPENKDCAEWTRSKKDQANG